MPSDPPDWIAAATAAAVRLAAEAGGEVDDLLQHHAELSPERRASEAVRLEDSARLSEVAADLAALLWAECAEVPPIATILDEATAQAALEAVAEARRQAAARLVDGTGPAEVPTTVPLDEPWPALADVPPVEAPPVEPALLRMPVIAPPPVEVVAGLAPVAEDRVPAASPDRLSAAGPPALVGSRPAGEVPVRRQATGAVLAGAAAAAILLFGRRLRRA